MLRQDSSRLDPDSSGRFPENELPDSGSSGVDIQGELDRIEEMILDSRRIPLTGIRLIDEEPLLDQLDLVRINLPSAFQEAEEIVRQKEEILLQAEEYAQQIIEAAERRADQILDEMGIIRQAEREAQQIRQAVQQECEAMSEQTISEIERMRLQAQQELQEMRSLAMQEAEDIQNGADDYADRVLVNIEQQLNDMLKVIRNGRQQLQSDVPTPRNAHTDAGGSSTRTSLNSPKK
ncbi:ATP synthase F0 subunit B [Trichocoleus sp. FACHB-90]|uniref:ATP synthase F0 subunit B n=1 Tax=Cyanophyceae TaxID=3028117 RepID=UPI001689F8C4|nr:ATP synthase F0 subunit B [Trichocoleus sp. FACHB-90]MBD1929885.1 ATP synthase F0 subunit B [Trichocoleus sp. FACHB-90]